MTGQTQDLALLWDITVLVLGGKTSYFIIMGHRSNSTDQTADVRVKVNNRYPTNLKIIRILPVLYVAVTEQGEAKPVSRGGLTAGSEMFAYLEMQ